jgi:hypothetical protein
MNDTVNATTSAAATSAATPVVLTKEEKIARIEVQIKNLQQKLEDVRNDVVRTPAKKIVYMPSLGDIVLATYGRTTATTQAKVVEGVVIGIREPQVVDGKQVGATQVRVLVGKGVDTQCITVYPAQLAPAPVAETEEEVLNNVVNDYAQ